MSCPSENTLLKFATGGLGNDALAMLEGHLDRCESCRQALAAAAHAVDDTGAARAGIATTASLPGAASAASLAAPARHAPGSRIGRYEVLETVGQGGMGVVYAGFDPELGRKVALKVIRVDRVTSDEAGDELKVRLLREAKAMARLDSPAVIAVHDVGMLGEANVFVAMEFVDGVNLTRWLRESKPAWPEVLRVFLDAGTGLQAAHGAGLIHRDFKPDNVLLGKDGRVRITDFGLARSVFVPAVEGVADVATTAPVGSATRTGTVLGTPAYMPPEQMLGHPVDSRADQFAFCVALYEGLYGERPFAGTTMATLCASVQRGEVRRAPPKTAVPRGLRRVLLRGLRAERELRFPSMEALLAELRPYRRDGQPRRRQLAMAALGLVALAVSVASVWRAEIFGTRAAPAVATPVVAAPPVAAPPAAAPPVAAPAPGVVPKERPAACVELDTLDAELRGLTIDQLVTRVRREWPYSTPTGRHTTEAVWATLAAQSPEARDCGYKAFLIKRLLDPEYLWWRGRSYADLLSLAQHAELAPEWNRRPRSVIVGWLLYYIRLFPKDPVEGDGPARNYLALFLRCALSEKERAQIGGIPPAHAQGCEGLRRSLTQ